MGASDQHRFTEAARQARSDGGVDTAAHMLSGLAMFDILPALASLDHVSRDRVLGKARSALAPSAMARIQYFSPEDIMIGRGNDHGRPALVLYLGTLKRQIKKLTAPALLQGADAEKYGLWGKPELVR